VVRMLVCERASMETGKIVQWCVGGNCKETLGLGRDLASRASSTQLTRLLVEHR
jgi:hypothetical protein